MALSCPSAFLTRLFLALLLATIGLQAAPHGGLALEQRHGSVFSADTVDLAIAPAPDRAIKAALPQPWPPAPPPAVQFSPLAAVTPVALPPGGNGATGPPPLAIASLPYPPRAPPLS